MKKNCIACLLVVLLLGLSVSSFAQPSIQITKEPDTQTVNAGEKATFTITVTNTYAGFGGDLENVKVSDSLTPDCARSIPDLAPGGSFTYTCMTNALSSGVTNVARVSADNFYYYVYPTDTDTAIVIVNRPEIEISKKAYRKDIFAGETATFRIKVRNTGNVTLTDIVISDPLTPDCEHRLRQLLPDKKMSYKCETEPLFEDFTNVVEVTAKSPSVEIEESDKAFVNIQNFDWGDAPVRIDPDPQNPTLVRDTARHNIHKIPELYLGLGVDSEPDAQPNIDATGDDNDGNDDEDGVVFNTLLIAGQQAQITVTAFDKGVLPGTQAGLLDAWIDYNDDGDWKDPGEQIFNNRPLAMGDNTLTFTVPASAVTVSPTYARFRFSSKGVLLPYRAAPDGEIEDYQVKIQKQ